MEVYTCFEKEEDETQELLGVPHSMGGCSLLSGFFLYFSSQRDGQADRKCFQHSQQQENKKVKYISRGN